MTTLRFNSPEQMITKGGNISDVGCSISNCKHKDSLTIGQSIMNYCAIRHTRISVPPPRQALTSSSPTQTWQSSYLQIRRWIYLIGGDNLPLPPINTHGTISERTVSITEVRYHVLPYDTITSTPGNAVRVGGSGHLSEIKKAGRWGTRQVIALVDFICSRWKDRRMDSWLCLSPIIITEVLLEGCG